MIINNSSDYIPGHVPLQGGVTLAGMRVDETDCETAIDIRHYKTIHSPVVQSNMLRISVTADSAAIVGQTKIELIGNEFN